MRQQPKGRRTVTMCIAMSPELYEEICQIAEEKGMTISAVGRKVMTRWVEKKRRAEK